MKHQHEPEKTHETSYNGCVSHDCRPLSHGGATIVEVCGCGARRWVNACAHQDGSTHVEYSEWAPAA